MSPYVRLPYLSVVLFSHNKLATGDSRCRGEHNVAYHLTHNTDKLWENPEKMYEHQDLNPDE
jgi:hypothetical protein